MSAWRPPRLLICIGFPIQMHHCGGLQADLLGGSGGGGCPPRNQVDFRLLAGPGQYNLVWRHFRPIGFTRYPYTPQLALIHYLFINSDTHVLSPLRVLGMVFACCANPSHSGGAFWTHLQLPSCHSYSNRFCILPTKPTEVG